jgi:hypothetical protein
MRATVVSDTQALLSRLGAFMTTAPTNQDRELC